MIGLDDLAGIAEPEEEADRWGALLEPSSRRIFLETTNVPSSRVHCFQPYYVLNLAPLIEALEPIEVVGPRVLGVLRSIGGQMPLQAIIALDSPEPGDPRTVAVLESARWTRHHVQALESIAAGVGIRRTILHPDGLGISAFSCGCSDGRRRQPITIEGAGRTLPRFR